jgi:hypothetical protein
MIPEQHDDLFIRLTTIVDGKKQSAKCGIFPPYGIFVEFRLLNGNGDVLRGMTATLGSMGPLSNPQTVFVVYEPDHKHCYFADEVSHWRELTDRSKITPGMLSFNRD